MDRQSQNPEETLSSEDVIFGFMITLNLQANKIVDKLKEIAQSDFKDEKLEVAGHLENQKGKQILKVEVQTGKSTQDTRQILKKLISSLKTKKFLVGK